MDDAELLSVITDEVNWASQARDDRSVGYDQALDYFYGDLPAKPTQDELDAGHSGFTSLDVQDAVFAVMAEILPAMGNAPVEFQPFDPNDEPQADVETRATDHVAQSSGLRNAVTQAVQDVLLRRAGVIQVTWEERAQVLYDDIDQAPVDAIPQMLAEQDPNDQIDVLEGEVDDQLQTFRAMIRRTRMRSRPRIEAIPLDELLIATNVVTDEIEDVRLIGRQRPVTRSELVERGADSETVAELQEITQVTNKSAVSRARAHSDTSLKSSHESTDYVMACDLYFRVDWDGDGIAERRHIVTAGGALGVDTLLINEVWDEHPFAIGVGYPGVFSWEGVSLFDRLKNIQDVKTDAIRDILDLMRRAARQRIGAVEGDAYPDDVLTSQVGGVIRMRTPQGIVTIPDPKFDPTLMTVLQYLDQVRKERGGGAIDQTQSAQAIGQGGDWSLERVMAAVEQINAMVARNITDTLIKPIYRKLHKLLRQYQSNPIMLPGSAGWVSATPAEWSPREELVISLGMSVGEKTQRMQALGQIQQDHTQLMQTGQTGVLVDLNGVYQAKVDFARLAGLPDPTQYYLDPQSPESQQAQQAAQQAAQQQAQQAQQQQQQMLQFQYSLMTDIERVKNEGRMQAEQMKQQTEQMKLMFQEQKAYMDNALNMFAQRVKLAEIEQKGDQVEAQQEIDRLQGAGKTRIERDKVQAIRDRGAQQ